MRVSETKISGVLTIDPTLQVEAKGFSLETFNERNFLAEGIGKRFVQDTLEFSYQNCLTGLRYRHAIGQAKLVYVVRGEVYYAAVDIRVGSASFGNWIGMTLSGQNMKQLYIPEGFAHGYCITSTTAQLICRHTEPSFPDASHGILWDDPAIGISWPVSKPIISTKDKSSPRLNEIPERMLPQYDSSMRASKAGC